MDITEGGGPIQNRAWVASTVTGGFSIGGARDQHDHDEKQRSQTKHVLEEKEQK